MKPNAALVLFCGLVLLWLGVTGRYKSLVAAWRVVLNDTPDAAGGALGTSGAPVGEGGGTTAWDNFKRGLGLQLPKLPGIGGASAVPNGGTAGAAGGGLRPTPPIAPAGGALTPDAVRERLRRAGYPAGWLDQYGIGGGR